MKKLNRYASISTIYGFENYKGTQINIFILQLQYIWPSESMGSGLSFAVSNVFIRPRKVFYPQNNLLYSINLFFTIFIMVNKLFFRKNILK